MGLVRGSSEWIESYSRRTDVEGFFANMKSQSAENVRRRWRRVVGIVKTSLLAVCAVAATNMPLLRIWAERRGGYEDALCAPLPPDHGVEELSAAEAAAVKSSSQPPRSGPALDAA